MALSAAQATQELLRRIDENPTERGRIIKAYYAELVAAGETETANLILTIRAITMARDDEKAVPPWFPVAGFISLGITILFFMALTIASMFQKEVPQSSRYLVVIVMSLAVAASFSFLGGSAVASGKIPIFKDSPLGFSVGGGIAVFVIVFALGNHYYL